MPTVTVELDLGGTWTALSDVVSVRWSRGTTTRREPWMVADRGECTVVCHNNSGRYDPDNTSSPLHPYLRPGTACRVKVSTADWTAVAWTGVLDGVDVVDVPGRSTATIYASDAVRVLARVELADASPSGASETGSTRVGRILDAAGWPSARRRVMPGGVAMAAVTLSGQAWKLIEDTSRDQLAAAVVDRAGNVVWRDFTHRSTYPSAWARAVAQEIASVGAWWRLDELVGTTAFDETGVFPLSHFNVVAVGQDPLILGDVGHSAGYVRSLQSRSCPVGDKTLREIATGQTTNNLINYDWSIECWANATVALTGNNACVVAVLGSHTGILYSHPNWVFYVSQSSGPVVTISTSATFGRPTHLVGTYVAATKQMRLYKDGVLVGTTTFTGTAINDGVLEAGGFQSNNTFHFDGTIDEVVVWRKALSAEEVADLHAAARWCHWADDASGLPYQALRMARADEHLVTEAYGTRTGGATQYVADQTALSTYGRYSLREDSLLLLDDDAAADWAGGSVGARSATRRQPASFTTVVLDAAANPWALVGVLPGDRVQLRRTTVDGRVLTEPVVVVAHAVDWERKPVVTVTCAPTWPQAVRLDRVTLEEGRLVH